MMENMAWVRPPRSQAEVDSLVGLALKDKHGVFFPTDIVWKDGEQVGYVSAGGCPFIFAWFSQDKMLPRDSFKVINLIENQLIRTGHPVAVWPIPKNSPFYEIMEKLGYTNIGTYDVFTKELK